MTSALRITVARPALPSGVTAGHPDDKWGWAVGAGLKVNFPMIGPGDYFQAQVGYAEGATKYTTNSSCGGSAILRLLQRQHVRLRLR